jgi:hypothetical protein
VRLTHDELERDHVDLLWVVDKLSPDSIHKDSRCTKMSPPHVLTADCHPQPDEESR